MPIHVWRTILLLGLTAMPVRGQPPGAESSHSLESYRRARDVLDGGIEALGGLERLSAAPTVAIRFEGALHWRHQSRLPEPPYDAEPFTATFILDRAGERLLYENEWRLPGGFRGHNRQVIEGEKGFAIDFIRRAVSEIDDPPAIGDHFYLERVPHLLVMRLLGNAASLRWLGTVEVGGRPHEAIVAVDDGNQVTLFFDPEKRLLTAYERILTDPIGGDVLQRRTWEGYNLVNGVQVPARYVQTIEGAVTQDFQFAQVQIGTAPADSLFARPEGFDPAPPEAWPSHTVSEIAPGVHFLEGLAPGYNVMFVEFADFVLVAEAPLGSAVAERAIEAIRETVPGKAVRYVVPTHHHEDHAGGLRAFIAEGATVVTTPGNVSFIRRMAAAPRSIDPDRLARNPRAPTIEAIEGKVRVVTDGQRTVEIHDIGPSPHAEEMLVVYLPAEEILFQGDLLNAASDLSLQPANETTEHFARWLEERKLQPRMILGVHSPARTPADLERALATAEQR